MKKENFLVVYLCGNIKTNSMSKAKNPNYIIKLDIYDCMERYNINYHNRNPDKKQLTIKSVSELIGISHVTLRKMYTHTESAKISNLVKFLNITESTFSDIKITKNGKQIDL